MSFAIFNEPTYLQNYPDVKAAVDAGIFPSGLEHFQRMGLAEGRTAISSQYDENAYLAANPDIAAAVQSGILKTGLQHYIFWGESERRALGIAPGNRGAGFNEQLYLMVNPDVASGVATGSIASGLAHYEFFGQFEGRAGAFTGTAGSDRITGFGQDTSIIGVGVQVFSIADGIPTSLGVGEMDILIGGEGLDRFYLGLGITPSYPNAQSFYVGNWDADFARIQNFDANRDEIHLAGSLSDYRLQPINGNLQISTVGGDLLAIVEGVSALEQDYIFDDNTFSLIGSQTAGFNEELYLMEHSDVAAGVAAGAIASGLAHYQLFGQFEGRSAAFTGTSGNDRITGFGQDTSIIGVGVQVFSIDDGIPTSLGEGEMDTLIGGAGQDAFALAWGPTASSPTVEPLYIGNGDADFARIQNFDPTADILLLANPLSNYQLQDINGGVNISTSWGDLVAIVEGISTMDLNAGNIST